MAKDSNYIAQLKSYVGELEINMLLNANEIEYSKEQRALMNRQEVLLGKQNEHYKASIAETEKEIARQKGL